MGYELLSHPADARFRARGPSLDDAFVEAVRAFAAIAEGGEAADSRREVHVESEDREALLFDFLADLVLLQELEGVAVVDAADCTVSTTADGYALDATLLVAPIEEPLFDVKSPTYSEMRVEEGDDGWVLEATLDV
ncbi:archease [Halomarina rubra]|uniref:Archease n=1 Tax=Halomarina rubra TaxID=2071873 RepID=A0ABD6AXX3_9EURY|nr:archease [Halomarina rubra]